MASLIKIIKIIIHICKYIKLQEHICMQLVVYVRIVNGHFEFLPGRCVIVPMFFEHISSAKIQHGL